MTPVREATPSKRARGGSSAGVAACVLSLLLASVPIGTGTFAQSDAVNDFPHPLSPSFIAGPNSRIYPGPVTQTEPFIARHPSDDGILFVAANTINLNTGFISEGIYVSSDRGAAWYGSDTCPGAPVQFHRGDPGIAIDKNGVFVLTRLGFSPGLYAHYSTDEGVTWSAQKQVASNDQDRADVATDADPASALYGTTYAAWVKFAPPYPVLISGTTDGGVNWTIPLQVNNPSQRGLGANIATGNGGTVYVCWAGVISSSPFTEDIVGFAHRASGDSAWTVTENAYDINGIAGTLPQKANIRVNGTPRMAVDNSGGPYDGRIYIVSTQKNLPPAGSDPDLVIRSSSDGGLSWSAAVRVNQDALNNGKIQYFPAIHVDDGGGVNILYYSDEPTTSDSSAVFLARSVDGGASWEAGEIGDHRFLPQPIGGLGAGYQGDNIALTSTGDTLRPVWTDNSSGIYQLWTCAVALPFHPNPVDEPATLPGGYALEQNYPNPFNPSTVIRFTLPRAEGVTLSVYDLSGKLVETLVSGRLPAGAHTTEFSAEDNRLGSGIYFCVIKTESARLSRKMLLVK